MSTYKNVSTTTKTFYGTIFEPGEIHTVPGHVNDPKMVKVKSVTKEPPEVSDKKVAQPVKSDEKSAKKDTADKAKAATDAKKEEK